jgi:hypothetical protein
VQKRLKATVRLDGERRKGETRVGAATGLAKIPEASILVSIVLGIFQVS